MSEKANSSDSDLTMSEAAIAARKLASSTNTFNQFNSSSNNSSTANSWNLPQAPAPSIGYPPMVPPPMNFYGGYPSYTGIQGMNFSSPMSSAAIPQISQNNTTNFNNPTTDGKVGNNQYPPNLNFTRFPPPSNAFPYSMLNYQFQHQWSNENNGQQQQQKSNQQNNNNNSGGGGGPKPIRFNLLKKTPNKNLQQQNIKKFFNNFDNNNDNININNEFSGDAFSFSEQRDKEHHPHENNHQHNNNNNTSSTPDRGYSHNNNSLGFNNNSNNNNDNEVKSSNNYNQTGANNKIPGIVSLSPANNSNIPQQGFGVGDIRKRQAQSLDTSVWPESLKDYVKRCFDLAVTNVDKDSIEIILKGKITRAANDSVLISKDWSIEPLPIINNGRLSMLPFAPIRGTISGKPIKGDLSPSHSGNNERGGKRGRGGRGRGGGVSRDNNNKKEGKKSRRSGRGRGFRSRSPKSSSRRSSSRSRSRSRSASMDSDQESNSKAKRLRLFSQDSDEHHLGQKKKNTRGGKNKKNKKAKLHNKKGGNANDSKIPHIYSEHGTIGVSPFDEDESNARRDARAARFAKENNSEKRGKPTLKSRLGGYNLDRDSPTKPVTWGIDTNSNRDRDFLDLESTNLVGTCLDLEKKYLRLTTAPDSSTVRPVEVLRDSLKLVKRKWKENLDYFYACDQLKSIRQDLTVQRIRSNFTVTVYETHARIALEKGDHEEYNQCQSQLCQLYSLIPNCQNRIEFTAYRILYYIFTANTLDLVNLMTSLSVEDKEDECIKHALQVRSAWSSKNYPKFFKLYPLAPKMGSYLVDWFVNRERKSALKVILKAYRPNVSTAWVISQLGFTNSDKDWQTFLSDTQLESAIEYVDIAKTKINAKNSYPNVTSILK